MMSWSVKECKIILLIRNSLPFQKKFQLVISFLFQLLMQFSVAWPESETLENLCLWNYSYQRIPFGSYFLGVCLLRSAVSRQYIWQTDCCGNIWSSCMLIPDFGKGILLYFNLQMLSLSKAFLSSFLFVSVFSAVTLCEDIQW